MNLEPLSDEAKKIQDPKSKIQNPSSFAARIKGSEVMLAVAGLAIIFALLTLLILRSDLQPTWWDIQITKEIQELPFAPVGVFLIAVSWPGFAPWNWLIGGAVVLVMLWRRWVSEAVFVALAAAGGLLAEIAKVFIDRPRPSPDIVNVTYVLNSYSFPSGHVTGYVSLFGFMFYLAYTLLPRVSIVRRAILFILGAAILLVGPSRIYMGQHWASDVMAGYALGFAYLLLLIQIYRSWRKRHVAAPPTDDKQ